MLYLDFGLALSGGVNGVGLRALELAAALSEHGPVSVVRSGKPHPDITAVWPQLRHVAPKDATPGPTDVYWYGFATPVNRIAEARRSGAHCVFDAIVWPLEFLTYETVRTATDPASAYQRRLSTYLRQLKHAHKFVVASMRERHVLTGMLSTSLWPGLHRVAPDLDPHFFELPVGFSQINETTSADSRTPHPDRDGNRMVLVWNGGTWNHYDPAVAVQAVRTLSDEGMPVELRFLYPQRGTETESLRRARQAAGGSKAIHFAQTGLGLLDRVAELSCATAAICSYDPHALWDLCPPMRLRETLIYQLPILSPRRGALGELIAEHGIGATANTNTLADWRTAMLNAAASIDSARQAAEKLAPQYQYENLAASAWTWLHTTGDQ